MERLGEAVSAFTLPSGVTSPQQVQATLTSLANRINPHAADMQNRGFALRSTAQNLDATLRQLDHMVRESGDEDMAQTFRDELLSLNASLASLADLDTQMDEFQDALMVPEQLSGSLRKSLRPVRRGVTALRDSLNLLNGWCALEGSSETPAGGQMMN